MTYCYVFVPNELIIPLDRNTLTYFQPVSLIFLSTSTTVHNGDFSLFSTLTNPQDTRDKHFRFQN